MVCIHVLKIAKVLVSAWTLYVLINFPKDVCFCTPPVFTHFLDHYCCYTAMFYFTLYTYKNKNKNPRVHI